MSQISSHIWPFRRPIIQTCISSNLRGQAQKPTWERFTTLVKLGLWPYSNILLCFRIWFCVKINQIMTKNLRTNRFFMISFDPWTQPKLLSFCLEADYSNWSQYLKIFEVSFWSLHIKVQLNAIKICLTLTSSLWFWLQKTSNSPQRPCMLI